MRFTTAILLGLLIVPAAFAREQTVLARVTVYWKGEGQMSASWNGARLREGHCAVDPNKIPYGSKVVFADGVECRAVDTGPAVVSRQAARSAGHNSTQRNALVVDRFFETKEQAMAWSDAHPHFMTLRVVEPGTEKKQLLERGAMLAQTIERSTKAAETIAASIHAPSGLQTADATAVALLPIVPLFRALRRRMARVRPRLCYAYA